MADNNIEGIPSPIQPGFDQSTPLSVFREAMGTLAPRIPNGEPMTVPSALNKAGNYQTGPNPSRRSANGTMDALNANVNFLNQADNWAKDTNAFGRSYFYGAGIHGANFERYYSHPKFKDLGFNPLRNNEAVYNENSSWWDDFNRMTSSYGSLFGAGFKSMYDFGSKDTAKSFENAMAVGMSSREGVGGFFTNLALNSAFTVGIASEMIAENFAIAGLTFATGGLAAAPALSAAVGKNAMAFQKVRQFGDALKSTKEMFAKLNNANNAREFFKTAEAAKTGGKFFDTLNPLSRSVSYLDDLSKGTNGFDKMNDFVKTRKAFGAFYRDLREINAVFSESMMEGEMAKNENNQKAIENYYKQNGIMPEGEEADKIYNMSKSIGFATSLANAPAIYFSNKLIFDNIFNGFKPPSVVGQELIEGTKRSLTKNKNWKIGDNVFSFMERQSSQKMKDILFNSSYMPWSKKYMLGNLAEGIQESLQDVSSAAATKYYEDLYNDPTAAGLYNGLNAIGSAMSNQFSKKGLETFLSGYLMGSLVQPMGAVFTSHKWAPGIYNKYFNSDQYKAEVQRQRDNENNIVNAVNTILKDPLGYFDKNVEHAMRTKKNAQAMNAAQQNGDQKGFQDAKDQLTYEHMMTLAETGKLDLLDEHFDGLLEMNDQELSEAFNQPKTEGSAIRKRVEDAKQQSLEFRNTYDAYTDHYQNPFNPKSYDPEKDKDGWNQEMARFMGYEDARRDAIMSNVFYKKTVSRMDSLVNDLSADRYIKNARTNDFVTLLSQNELRQEIQLLSREIEVLKEGDANQKKEAKLKQTKLDALEDFMNYGLQYQIALAESKKELTRAEKQARSLSVGSRVKSKKTNEKFDIIEDLGDSVKVRTKSGMVKKFKKTNVLPITDAVIRGMREANKGLYKVFMNYAKSVSNVTGDKQVNQQKLDDAFIKVRDWFNLREDSQNLVEAVNILNNPSAFMRHAEKQAMIQAFKRENLPGYIRSSYRRMHEQFKDSAFLNEIYDLGMTIDPDDAARVVLNNDYTNIDFFYFSTGEPVAEDDPKLVEARKIVEKYAAITQEKNTSEKKEDGVEPAEEEEVEEKPLEPTEKVEEQIPNYEIYKQLVALFRKSEQDKAAKGEATSGLEKTPDKDLRVQTAFLEFAQTNSEAIALTEQLPKKGEGVKPTEKEIKEENWTPNPVPAGLEKLKNLWKEVVKLTKDEKNYFNKLGELFDRVSSLKKPKPGLPSENIMKLSSERGNLIDMVIRELFKGNVTNKVEMVKMIAEEARKKGYAVQFDQKAVGQLFTILDDVSNSVKAQGFKVHSDIPTLFGNLKGLNLPQGGNIAGTIDLLVEKDGKFYIIDLKTATADRKSEEGKGRYLEDDTIQLNAYRQLIQQQTGVKIEGIYVFPITVKHGRGYKIVSSASAPKFTMDELIPIEIKDVQELRPELFEGAAPAPTAPAPADAKISPYGMIAADYLFTGGQGVILSTDYFIQALSGAFYKAGVAIEQIRQKYINQGIDLGNLKDAIGTENYAKIIDEIRSAIESTYNNQEVNDIFNVVLNNATGFPYRLGQEVSSRLETLNEQLTTQEPTVSTDAKTDIEIRRQKAESKITPIDIDVVDKSGNKTGEVRIKEYATIYGEKRLAAKTEEELKKLIQVEYNAELAALGAAPAAGADLGFQNLANIGNQGLAIMESDLQNKGYSEILTKGATPEQLEKIENDIKSLQTKYDLNVSRGSNNKGSYIYITLPIEINTIQNGTITVRRPKTETFSEYWVFNVKDGKLVSGVYNSYFQGEYRDQRESYDVKNLEYTYRGVVNNKYNRITYESTDAPAPKEITLEQMISEANTPEGYEALRMTLIDKLRNDSQFRKKYNLTADSVRDILSKKYDELAMSFKAEDIKKDTFAILKDGRKVRIINRTKNDYTYQSIEGGAEVTKPISGIYETIQSVYKPGMETMTPPVTVPATEPVQADSKKESDNSIQDLNDPAVKQQMVNDAIASKMTEAEAIDNLKNKLC